MWAKDFTQREITPANEELVIHGRIELPCNNTYFYNKKTFKMAF
jgi:hypothetical protein